MRTLISNRNRILWHVALAVALGGSPLAGLVDRTSLPDASRATVTDRIPSAQELQHLLDDVLPDGGRVEVPEGAYVISGSSLFPKSNTRIICASPRATTFKAAPGDRDRTLLQLKDVANVTIENCGFEAGSRTWDGDHTRSKGTAIYLAGASNVVIRGSYFTGCYNCIGADEGSNLRIVDNDFYTSHAGLADVHLRGIQGVVIAHNHFQDAGVRGSEMVNALFIYDGDHAARGYEIGDNVFKGFDKAGVETMALFFNSGSVHHNWIEGDDNTNGHGMTSDHRAIDIGSVARCAPDPCLVENVTVDHNVISKAGVGIRVNISTQSGTDKYISVDHNVIRETSQFGISVEDGASAISIVGNVVRDTKALGVGGVFGAGIRVAQVAHVSIQGNTVDASEGDGILVQAQSKHVSIQSNVVRNSGTSKNQRHGIDFFGTPADHNRYGLITGNLVIGSAAFGISLIDSDDISILENDVSDNGHDGTLDWAGIGVERSLRPIIRGNVVRVTTPRSHQAYGIKIGAEVESPVVEGNVIGQNRRGDIYVHPGTTNVKGIRDNAPGGDDGSRDKMTNPDPGSVPSAIETP